MQAASAPAVSNPRMAARAALAAIIFAAGIALGAVVGTTVASVAAPHTVTSTGLDPDASWFQEYRIGERAGNPASGASRDPDSPHPGDGRP